MNEVHEKPLEQQDPVNRRLGTIARRITLGDLLSTTEREDPQNLERIKELLGYNK